MSDTLQGVNFNIIRYANCWEDAGVLLHALEGRNPRRIAIIASAGDNALALLANAPETVLGFDISLPQLYLAELKQAAFYALNYDELLQAALCEYCFTGAADTALSAHRGTPFTGCEKVWQERKALVEKGLIHSGKFEHYFALFRRYCLPLVHSQKSISALLRAKTDEEQKAFYHQHWNGWRWRLLMKLFFSRAVMGRAGRDPQFLKQVRLSVSDYIRTKAESHLQSSEATRNPFLRYIFTGSFGGMLPHYLRPENYEAIRANIGRLTLRQASADDVVAMQSHDAYCLSNIFEYFPQEAFDATVTRWTDLLPPGALLLFWNLMVPRSFAAAAPDAFAATDMRNGTPDAGFFYSAFLNEQRL